MRRWGLTITRAACEAQRRTAHAGMLPRSGHQPEGERACRGRCTGVSDMTMDEERPWYATGRLSLQNAHLHWDNLILRHGNTAISQEDISPINSSWLQARSCAPIGAESMSGASQHRATICGMLSGQIEVCVIPNAHWQMHLHFILYQDPHKIALDLSWTSDCKSRPLTHSSGSSINHPPISPPAVSEPWTSSSCHHVSQTSLEKAVLSEFRGSSSNLTCQAP